MRKPGEVQALYGAVSKAEDSETAVVKLRAELELSSTKSKRSSGESEPRTAIKRQKVKPEGKARGTSEASTAAKGPGRGGDPVTCQSQQAYSRIALLRPEVKDALAEVPSKADAKASGAFKRKIKVG